MTSCVIDVRSADGTRLHTEIHGRPDAPIIVLSHGITCSISFWRNQIEQLSADFRVVAFDHRGHGKSEAARSGSYSLDHLADDLHAVLTATVPAGRKAVVAGHSMGGIAVMAWAQRYPDDVPTRVQAVALVNTTSGQILDHVRFLRGPERLIGLRRRLAVAVVPLARLPLPRRMPLRRRVLAHVAVGASAAAEVAFEVDRMVGSTSARGRGGYGALLVGMVEHVDAGAVDVPTMVIAGRSDKITPIERSRLIASKLPQLIELVELDSGHCGPLECPGAVTEALRGLALKVAHPQTG